MTLQYIFTVIIRLICEGCALLWQVLVARSHGTRVPTYWRLADESGVSFGHIRHPERLRNL